MKSEDIKNHWRDWSVTHGTALRATTKTPTAKAYFSISMERWPTACRR